MLEFNGTAIVIAISFLIFVILEDIIFYSPMKKILNERDDYISANEKDAEDNISAAKTLIAQKDEKIAQAKNKSSQLLNEVSLSTQEKFDSSIREAKLNSNEKIEEIKKNLESEKKIAQDALRSQIGNYATSIISKILKKEVAIVNLNDEMIEKAMRGEL